MFNRQDRQSKRDTAAVTAVVREVEAVRGPVTARQLRGALADQGRFVSDRQAQDLLNQARSASS
jgi:hypothetical protein